MLSSIAEEERKAEEFFQEHGYPSWNFEELVVYMLRKEEISEEGMQELWTWYSKELGKE